MSTIYDFDEKNGFEAIETHYFNDGYDVAGLVEDGDVYVSPALCEFSERYIEVVEDVFVGDNTTFVVARIEPVSDQNDPLNFLVFEMSTAEFKANWSKSIWAKFREDTYIAVCPECGQKKAYFVSGQSAFGEERHQFHCANCHYTWVGYPSGKFVREGVLLSEDEIRQMRGY